MTRSSPLRLAWLIALTCAVSLRLLTPPGWMPNLEGRGPAPLVICAGDGVHTVTAPADPASPHPGGKTGHEVCAFAGLTVHTAAAAIAVAAPVAAPQALEARLSPARARPALDWRRPQSPRGPPRTA